MSSSIHKLRVFLCYTSQDKPVVRELYQKLLAEGWVEPWLDEENLLPGQKWDLEIEKAVKQSDAVIVFLSNNSISKEGYIQKELRTIFDIANEKPETTIFIIPVRLDNCAVPNHIHSRHWVDYFPKQKKRISYQRIVKSLSLCSKRKLDNEFKNKGIVLSDGTKLAWDKIVIHRIGNSRIKVIDYWVEKDADKRVK